MRLQSRGVKMYRIIFVTWINFTVTESTSHFFAETLTWPTEVGSTEYMGASQHSNYEMLAPTPGVTMFKKIP